MSTGFSSPHKDAHDWPAEVGWLAQCAAAGPTSRAFLSWWLWPSGHRGLLQPSTDGECKQGKHATAKGRGWGEKAAHPWPRDFPGPLIVQDFGAWQSMGTIKGRRCLFLVFFGSKYITLALWSVSLQLSYGAEDRKVTTKAEDTLIASQ